MVIPNYTTKFVKLKKSEVFKCTVFSKRTFKIVVKKLHFSMDTVLINDEIPQLGHKVRIDNIKSRIS